MTPEAQRIAIAKAAGITLDYDNRWMSPYGWIPFDLLNDLNAMSEAERTLTVDQYIEYSSHLFESCDCWPEAVRATAAQRAEAFLRTLSLWTET